MFNLFFEILSQKLAILEGSLVAIWAASAGYQNIETNKRLVLTHSEKSLRPEFFLSILESWDPLKKYLLCRIWTYAIKCGVYAPLQALCLRVWVLDHSARCAEFDRRLEQHIYNYLTIKTVYVKQTIIAYL